ncbi:hypothetical protein ACJO5Y_18210 [Marinobacter sp. GN3S48]|uniref:hypothetical protein n=1 Tax=Marinobacter sp. GN3S48 TaxID=3382302 RepID=UPI00387AAB9B
MTPDALFKDRTVKLISFSIGKRSFSVSDALNASGMGLSEFLAIGPTIYSQGADISHEMNIHEVRDWFLKPDALFGYMGLTEFQHSVKSANQAKKIAIASIVISGILALGPIATSWLGG